MASSGTWRLTSMAIRWLVPRSAEARDSPRYPLASPGAQRLAWAGDWAGHLQKR